MDRSFFLLAVHKCKFTGKSSVWVGYTERTALLNRICFVDKKAQPYINFVAGSYERNFIFERREEKPQIEFWDVGRLQICESSTVPRGEIYEN